jgi:hypothetical protein
MSRGNFIVITPEKVADHLERLVNDPAELREQIEANVLAKLQHCEITARFGAVVLRRIRDKELYVPSGWPSWRDFCAHFSPAEPERIDIFIRALEVLESRGEKRDFGEPEARRIAEAAQATTGEVLPADGSIHPGNARQFADHSQGTRAAAAGVSVRTQRKLDHLANVRPDLLEEVRARRLSAHGAAREAGIVKDPDPFRELKRWWGRASDHDRMRFEDFIEQWHREDEEVA